MKRFVMIMISLALILNVSLVFASGSGQQGGKTVIRVAHFYDGASGASAQMALDWLNKLKAEFERENPNVVVEWEMMQWDQIDVKIISDFRSNITAHDVTFTSPQLFPLHSEVGDLEDLNPYIKRDWSAARLGEVSWASTYQQGLQNGKQIAIPLGSHARVLIWNKDHFTAAGLDPNKPPKTMEELIAYAQKLTIDKNGDGVIDQYGFGTTLAPNRGTIELSFGPLLWGLGGDLIDPATKAAVFADSKGVQVAEQIWDMVNTYKILPPDAVTTTYDVGEYFYSERVSMSFGWGHYFLDGLQSKGWVRGLSPPRPDAQLVKVGVAQYPTPTEANFTNSWAISIYQKSQNKELAWKFIDTMLKSNLNEYPDAGLPIKQTEWQKPEYQTEYYKTYYRAIETGKPMPQTPYFGELADTVAAALQRCISAPKSDIPRILREAQQEYNSKSR
ncbi:MAG: sugar ABC transporter substrate-binding protein [Spirochaetaceae bacterium]|jgi:multiple sugar transport system substrate-binding protein|nr:sugar ABC transporter substrate-binding protein [Spirochaetaceae bacterium]